MRTKTLLLNEYFKNFISFSIDSFSKNPNLILIFNDKIEIIKINDEDQIERRYNIAVAIDKLFITCYWSPFLSYCQILKEKSRYESYSMTVWKIGNYPDVSISMEYEIEAVYDFVFYTHERDKEIYNATFFECFLFAISFINNNDRWCLTRLVNKNGDKFRDLNFYVLEISHQETVFYKFNEKLFVERESYHAPENTIFQMNFEAIRSQQLQTSIPVYEILEFKQDDINGVLNFVINKTFISCGRILYFENKPVLRIKTLNYWAVDTYARPGMENMALALTPFDIDA